MMVLNTNLWGNAPAYDLINFSQNEGKNEEFKQPTYDILFASSGDLRIMLETFDSVQKVLANVIEVNIHINDVS